jgi:elongation factor P
MPKASDVERGQVIDLVGAVHAARQIDRSSPTARGGGTLLRLKVEGLPGGTGFVFMSRA